MMKWDLTYLYKTKEDWEKDLTSLPTYIKKIASFEGKLHEFTSFRDCMLLQEEMDKVISRVYQYASLKSDLNKKDVSNAGDYNRVLMILNQLNVATSYTEPEILSLGLKKVQEFIAQDERLKPYTFVAEKLFHKNEHVLSGDKEQLLSYYAPLERVGSSLYSTLAVADNVNKTIRLSSGQKVVVTQGNWSSLIEESSSEKDRKKIFEAIYEKFDLHKNTFAEIYNSVMASEKAYIQTKKYKSILEANLFTNNIPTTVFKNLIEVASKENASLKKYYELKKKHLNLKSYHTYDRFLQLAKSDKKYSYEEAKELFFASITSTPTSFQEKAHEVLRDGFVDVYEQDGKRSGAYSSSMPDLHPFILLNYSSTLDDVFTVAHEAGHSIHSMYAAEAQPATLQGYTIFVAEIASTFNEHMLLDYLMQSSNTSKEEKIMLLQKSIDEIVSTFYRQTLFANYEYEVSKLVEKDVPLNHEVLSNIMIKLYKKYYGLNIKKEKLKQYVWAYIPHLYYTPFYVYQYATSFAASFALYKNVKDGKENAFEKYTNLLKSGGSKYPVAQALEAGVDFTKKETFMAVVERMDSLVAELEKLIG